MKKHQILLIAAAFALACLYCVFELADSPRFASEPASTVIFTDRAVSYGSAAGEKININTAGIDELMTLEDIGETRARAIIEYREANGRFYSVDELSNVSGIGSKTVELNRNRITV